MSRSQSLLWRILFVTLFLRQPIHILGNVQPGQVCDRYVCLIFLKRVQNGLKVRIPLIAAIQRTSEALFDRAAS